MSDINAPKTFLLIESEAVGRDLAMRLERLFDGCAFSFVKTMEEALEALSQQSFNAAFIEIRLGEADSLHYLQGLHDSQVATPFVGIVPRALWGMAQDVVRYGVVDLLERDGFDDFALRKAVLFACCRESNDRERFNAATRDPLTGLVNQEMLLDRLRMALRRAERDRGTVGLFYIDINGFKEINALYGKNAGDILLKRVAERMTRNVRRVDTVARVNSDEFAIVLEKPGGLPGCLSIAAGIREKIQKLYDVDGLSISLEISVGVGLFPEDERNFEDLLSLCRRRARQAREENVGVLPIAPGLDAPTAEGV